MTDFTPGPWELDHDSLNNIWDIDAGDNHIASCTHSLACIKLKPDEIEANARLIVNAPKMYAALKRFVEANDNYDDDEPKTLREFANARTECKDVIAKVELKA